MIDIRQPNISANSQEQQVLQMRSYLYQLAQQLQWAFSTLPESGGSGASASSSTDSNVTATKMKVNPQETFAALKDLIIKSSDIVNAYYDQINTKLEGLYVGKSDFGTYVEQTSADISANSEGVNQLFESNRTILLDIERWENNVNGLSTAVGGLETNAKNLEESVDQIAAKANGVSDAVDALRATSLETNAYIRTGMLYEDASGTPVYGLEVGQTNDVNGVNIFTKFARFSSDRLSFYDRNDTEVAFISDYKLYITNAEITGALTLTGRFKVYYENGLAFKWIGG